MEGRAQTPSPEPASPPGMRTSARKLRQREVRRQTPAENAATWAFLVATRARDRPGKALARRGKSGGPRSQSLVSALAGVRSSAMLVSCSASLAENAAILAPSVYIYGQTRIPPGVRFGTGVFIESNILKRG